MEQQSEPDSTVSCGSDKSCCGACHCVPKSAIDLVMWRDVKKTIPVFVGGLIFLFMLDNMSVISVVAYCGLLTLVCAGIAKALGKFAPKLVEGCPYLFCVCTGDETKKCEITREQAERFVDLALPHINSTMACARDIFTLANPVETAKFALLFWILTYIGAWFNLLTLIITAFILVFSAPRVYEQFQPQFDNLGALLKANLDQVFKLAQEKVDMVKQKVRERSGKEKAQ